MKQFSVRQKFLRDTLAKESRAYGFTIAFWGSGAMLLQKLGTPVPLEIFAYGLGSVLGFGLLALYVYRDDTFNTVRQDEAQIVALSMVHYIAAMIPIVGAYFLSNLPGLWAFLTAGMLTSIGYNFGMIIEEVLAEKIVEIRS